MKEKSKMVKISGIVIGVLFLLTIVASILIRNLNLPAGLFLFLSGLFSLVLSIMMAGKKKSSGQEDKNIQLMTLLGVFECIIGLVFITMGMKTVISTINDNRYTKTLNTTVDKILSKNKDSGEKFVVYDVKREVFCRNYLSDQYRAEAAEDIAGVLIIETDYDVVGHYSSGDDACKYVLNVTMKEPGSDDILSTKYIYGSEPPETVRKSVFSWEDKHFGSFPSEKEIREECDDMIAEYIEDKARRERVVLMSEDEMIALCHRIITENADADGWIMVSDMYEKIQEEQPDFRIKDYPYTSEEFLANHPDCFETERRSIWKLGLEFPAPFVRWIGN